MSQYSVVCGGATHSGGAEDEEVIELDVQGPSKNVNLRIEDLNKALLSNIPDVLLDLLEVAAYVYCADQRISRGSDKLTDHGRKWRRSLHFTIPLRQPDLWDSDAVSTALRDTLGFLSDDAYSFDFVKATKPLAERSLYFPNLVDGTFVPDDIALFSGGVDSFAGAVEDVIGNGKKMVLVGHHSATKVFSVQKELIDGLQKMGAGRNIFYVSVNVTNTGAKVTEYTQRTRSFLFASLALVVARMFGKDEFTFYENGVVGLNIPIAKDVLGARATRTTHPKVVQGFEAIFSALLDREVSVKTPYQWLTKREVTEKIRQYNCGHLLSKTSSCTRPKTWTKHRRHCGACSQCIDRRFGVLAAGMGELDPADGYELDLLLGDRSLERDIRMAVAYVKFSQTFSSLTKVGFISEHPQITSALRFLPGLSADEARDKIYDLYRRHAQDVLDVIRGGLQAHADELVRGELPAGSLLSMCFSRGHIDIPPPSGYDQKVKDFMDGLGKPVCEFAVDADAGRILFKGGFFLEGTNFKLVQALLDNHRIGKKAAAEIAYVAPSALADALSIDEQSLRQQIARLKKAVNETLPAALGIVLEFIENKQREGYRLNPELREVSKGDL
ncbi:conserved hypothetical protein [Magnetospirillum sp. SS-4]|nr:conserved hypothetical protein [Magnetospirillum sp. SS-4]